MRLPVAVALLLLFAVSGYAQERMSGPWVMEDSRTTASLRGIHAVGGGVAWASGTDGTVLRTEDGGYMWQSCEMPPGAEKLDFRGIQAWDADTALVMSSGPASESRIYKTTDGCSHWKLVFTDPVKDGFFDALLFLDRNNGLVLGDPVKRDYHSDVVEGDSGKFAIRTTNDGGDRWAPVVGARPSQPGDPSRSPVPLPGEAFFAASNSSVTANGEWLWIATSKSRVLRRKIRWHGRPIGFDPWAGLWAGQLDPVSHTPSIQWNDWQIASAPVASSNSSSGIFSIAFRDEQHGMVVGGDYTRPNDSADTAAWTADGGEHWTAAGKPTRGYRSTVAWDATAKAWIAAGTNGSDISYDDGRTWQPLDHGDWNAISLPWIAGPHGRVGKLDEKRLRRTR